MKLMLWIDARWPLSAMIRIGLDEEIPGGAKYAYVFGSAALIVFLLQIVTGIWQVFYYVPTLKEAYNSLSYFGIEVPFGWLIHGFALTRAHRRWSSLSCCTCPRSICGGPISGPTNCNGSSGSAC